MQKQLSLSQSLFKTSVEHWINAGWDSSLHENFSSISLFGVTSGVFWESRLTCHCVWRCATALEYISVQSESVCVCVGAQMFAELLLPRSRRSWRTEESPLQNGAILAGSQPCCSPGGQSWALQLHACVPLLVGVARSTDDHRGRGRWEAEWPLMMMWESNMCSDCIINRGFIRFSIMSSGAVVELNKEFLHLQLTYNHSRLIYWLLEFKLQPKNLFLKYFFSMSSRKNDWKAKDCTA